MDTKIIEGNKLIFEFMLGKEVNNPRLEMYNYDKDWNHLISVVEKLCQTKNKGKYILPKWELTDFLDFEIKKTWENCVNLIKWYNKNK